MMMMLNLYMAYLLFFFGLVVFISNQKHLLSMLLSLEFMALGLFMNLVIFFNLFMYENYFTMIFLVFCVCEGALGLGILVSLIRTHGNDYFQSLNIL
uniref:NADH dehydrogenase subunit 4L n=1 Tax=Clogmia albipunctata TaxID=85120 RepID=UPI001EE12800|nr:NADH dehydrogenase subunit 4L [Clogmia albipunctata]UHY38879.1 NADH dehydrogenase subunit 4L [Clogmia albipunctata]